jgi:hypothetical protein
MMGSYIKLFSVVLLLTIFKNPVAADLITSNLTCYDHRGYPTTAIPCSNSTTGHVSCCSKGDDCLSNAICAAHDYNNPVTFWYSAGCTDPTYSNKSVCGSQCPSYDGFVYCDPTKPSSNHGNNWECCFSSTCDCFSDDPTERFSDPAPSALSTLASAITTTSASASAIPLKHSSSGLSTQAKAAIAFSVFLVVVLLVLRVWTVRSRNRNERLPQNGRAGTAPGPSYPMAVFPPRTTTNVVDVPPRYGLPKEEVEAPPPYQPRPETLEG